MAVSEDRKFTKEQVYTLLEGAKGKTLGEVDLRPPEFVYPKENRNHPFSHLSQLLLGKNHVDDGPASGCWESGAQNRYYKSGKP